MEDKYMSLITEYIDGTLSSERKLEFDQYVAEGHIVMEEVEAMMDLQRKMESAPKPEPSDQLRSNFYDMLAEAQASTNAGVKKESFLELLNKLFFDSGIGKLAFGLGVLIVGFFVGNNFGDSKYQKELTSINGQMADMQEMMMMSMLEKESVTDRLKGIQMSSELPMTNTKVTDALFTTLNNDRSTNVRMAALSALSPYTDNPKVREGLINSISKQESPLMQVALAELMVELQEKKSIEEFKGILESENTPEEVKNTLQESIEKIM